MTPTFLATGLAVLLLSGAGGAAGSGTMSTSVPGVRVALNGNDASCSRGLGSTACASFARAYELARPGDVVTIESGVYGPQTILATAAGGKPGTHSVRFVPASGAAVVVDGSVNLGIDGVSTAPSYVEFDGRNHLVIEGQFRVNYADGVPAAHDSLLNTHIRDSSKSQGALVFVRDAAFFTALGNEIGPGCCSSDGIGIEIRNPGDPVPDHIVLAHNRIHDLYDSCSEYPARLGVCSGIGYGDPVCVGDCDHIDGIQAFGAINIDVDGNEIYLQGAHKQGLFLGSGNGGRYENVLIANNMLSRTSDQTLSIGGVPISGYLRLSHNTVLGDFHLSDGWVVPGTLVEFAGNIFEEQAGDQSAGGCTVLQSDGSPLIPIWRHNLMGYNPPCGRGDVAGKASFIRPTFSETALPDLRMRAASVGHGLGDPERHPVRDVDGNLRPQADPDAGASQRETAEIVPGVSIGAAHLGQTEAGVASFYGKPRSIRRAEIRGSRVLTFRVSGGSLAVTFDARGRAARIATTSSYYFAPASGLAAHGKFVGDPATRPAKVSAGDSCRLLATADPRRGVYVELESRGARTLVRSISVARKGWGSCGQ